MTIENPTEFVALVGPPNSGKTTLFNWLTGHIQKVVNYPGSTVSIAKGEILPFYMYSESSTEQKLVVIDTPGTYSLFPKSYDEEITCQALFGDQYNFKKAILVLDSTQISRQLHLAYQLREAGFAFVVAVTMHDLHTKEGGEVNVAELEKRFGVPFFAIDGELGGGIKPMVQKLMALSTDNIKIKNIEKWSLSKQQEIFKESESIAKLVVSKKISVYGRTESKDQFLLHPIWGSIVFILVMLTLFSSIYWLSSPLMDGIDAFFGWFANIAQNILGQGMFSNFIASGLITGIGSVLIFVPQIFILFVGISLLEDTGYLARAAAIVDKPLSKIGLNGKAFVPILSGFACAVPAIMAVRSIHSLKERRIATFIIPFMTCSARLPVYALLLGFLFAHRPFLAGAALTGLYLGGIIVGAIAAALLKKIVDIQSNSFFLMELPLYRRPKFKSILRNSFRRTSAYVVKTGPIILVLSVVLWVLSTFPKYDAESSHVRLEQSYASQMGQILEPVFKPMGADWRVGVSLISAFAAREVFVSSLAVMLNIEGADELQKSNENSLREGIIEKMRTSTWPDGRKLFTPASVVSLLIFFMLALQCLSTFAISKQESGSLRFALVQLVSMNLLGYLAAVFAYSVMS